MGEVVKQTVKASRLHTFPFLTHHMTHLEIQSNCYHCTGNTADSKTSQKQDPSPQSLHNKNLEDMEDKGT